MDTSSPENKGKQRMTEVLEIEDEEQRHERIHDLFSRLNASTKPATTGGAGPRALDPQRLDFGDRTTFPAQPPLELLSRVQAFLPELAASNADLLRRAKEDPSSVDIENVDADQPQYIEMNLGLGVFEQHGEVPPGLAIPVATVDLSDDVEMDSSDSGDSSSSASTSSEESGSDADADADSDSEEGDADSEVDIILSPSSASDSQAPRPIKPLPRRNRPTAASEGSKPEIVVLSESNDRGT